MTYLTDNALFSITMSIVRIADTTIDDAQRIIAPLEWYITTGRCSGRFEAKINHLTKRQVTTITKRLIHAGGFDYDQAIASVKDYLDHVS